MDFLAAMRIYLLILAFIFGACIGSFVNCAADRYCAKESILRGRSHCPVCHHALGFLDLFPIFSYLFLRGKCRYCGAKIPIRCLLTELTMGLSFLLAALKFGFTLQALECCMLLAALLAVALIDFDTMEIPDGLLLFGAVVFEAFLFAYDNWQERLTQGLLGAVIYGGGMLLISLIMDAVLKKESLGGGDVKLYALLGLFLGPAVGLVCLILSCLIGLLAAAFGKKGEFPFGPSIAIAAFISLMVGEKIISLYLSIFL